MVPGDIPTSGCLNGDFETGLDDLRVYRASQIQAFPHRPSGRQQFVNRGEVHGEVSSASFPARTRLAVDIAQGVWQHSTRKKEGAQPREGTPSSSPQHFSVETVNVDI